MEDIVKDFIRLASYAQRMQTKPDPQLAQTIVKWFAGGNLELAKPYLVEYFEKIATSHDGQVVSEEKADYLPQSVKGDNSSLSPTSHEFKRGVKPEQSPKTTQPSPVEVKIEQKTNNSDIITQPPKREMKIEQSSKWEANNPGDNQARKREANNPRSTRQTSQKANTHQSTLADVKAAVQAYTASLDDLRTIDATHGAGVRSAEETYTISDHQLKVAQTARDMCQAQLDQLQGHLRSGRDDGKTAKRIEEEGVLLVKWNKELPYRQAAVEAAQMTLAEMRSLFETVLHSSLSIAKTNFDILQSVITNLSEPSRSEYLKILDKFTLQNCDINQFQVRLDEHYTRAIKIK